MCSVGYGTSLHNAIIQVHRPRSTTGQRYALREGVLQAGGGRYTLYVPGSECGLSGGCMSAYEWNERG